MELFFEMLMEEKIEKYESPHKFRHSFTKEFLDDSDSLVTLRNQLDYNSIETTSLYINLSQEEQRQVLHRTDSNEK